MHTSSTYVTGLVDEFSAELEGIDLFADMSNQAQ